MFVKHEFIFDIYCSIFTFVKVFLPFCSSFDAFFSQLIRCFLTRTDPCIASTFDHFTKHYSY